MATDYTQMTDPSTGLPFASQAEGEAWSAGQKAAHAAAGTAAGTAGTTANFAGNHNTTYDFNSGNNTAIYSDPGSGYIYFGGAGSGLNGGSNFTERLENGSYTPSGAAGYIDPVTGHIVYGEGSAPMTMGSNGEKNYAKAPTGGTSREYYYNQDYGLGSSALGIIPLMRDAHGMPTKYYAGTGTGGGMLFDDLASAQTAVAAYKTWYDGQHPAGTSGTQIAPTAVTTPAAATDAATTVGTLAVPGVGENYYGATQDLYGQPTNAQKLLDATTTGPTNAQKLLDATTTGPSNAQRAFDTSTNQPSDQEQLWQKYSGIYQNPDYLKDYYARAQQAAQTTLDRKSATAGWGDSGAAAKATGNLGAVYGDAAIKGLEAFSTTGMGLAGASDSGRTARTKLYGDLASGADTSNLAQQGVLTSRASGADTSNLAQQGVLTSRASGADTSNLAYLTSGQTSADNAESLAITRITGGVDRATQLAQDQSALVLAGFKDADAQQFSTQLATLQGEWTAAGLTAQQQYTKATELAATFGQVSNSALNYWLGTKFGVKTPTYSSSTPMSTTLPSVQLTSPSGT
jgi:hypothetical protein